MAISLRIEDESPHAEQLSNEERQLAMLFLEAILTERRRAHAKHGATSMEQSGILEHRRASILMEEAAECGRALNDHEHGWITLYGGVHADTDLSVNQQVIADELDKELIQTAAMAYTWWANRRGDRLKPPEPAPLCVRCGQPEAGVHSKTRDGGYLTGHAFVTKESILQASEAARGRAFHRAGCPVRTGREPCTCAAAETPVPARTESYEAIELLRQILQETHLMVPTRRKVEALIAGYYPPAEDPDGGLRGD